MSPISVFLVATILFPISSPTLECYFCQTVNRDDCYYGAKSLHSSKCDPGECISITIEVLTKDGQYTRTLRGCNQNNNSDPCAVLMRTESKLAGGITQKPKSCTLCSRNLCNGAARASGLVALSLVALLRKLVA